METKRLIVCFKDGFAPANTSSMGILGNAPQFKRLYDIDNEVISHRLRNSDNQGIMTINDEDLFSSEIYPSKTDIEKKTISNVLC
jgi:hypothetical protein